MYTDPDRFCRVTTGRLQNHGYFQVVYCTTAETQTIVFPYNIATSSLFLLNGVAKDAVNFLETKFIMQPAFSDVKISPAGEYG